MLTNIQTGFFINKTRYTVTTRPSYTEIHKRFLPGISTLKFVETLKFLTYGFGSQGITIFVISKRLGTHFLLNYFLPYFLFKQLWPSWDIIGLEEWCYLLH